MSKCWWPEPPHCELQNSSVGDIMDTTSMFYTVYDVNVEIFDIYTISIASNYSDGISLFVEKFDNSGEN